MASLSCDIELHILCHICNPEHETYMNNQQKTVIDITSWVTQRVVENATKDNA